MPPVMVQPREPCRAGDDCRGECLASTAAVRVAAGSFTLSPHRWPMRLIHPAAARPWQTVFRPSDRACRCPWRILRRQPIPARSRCLGPLYRSWRFLTSPAWVCDLKNDRANAETRGLHTLCAASLPPRGGCEPPMVRSSRMTDTETIDFPFPQIPSSTRRCPRDNPPVAVDNRRDSTTVGQLQFYSTRQRLPRVFSNPRVGVCATAAAPRRIASGCGSAPSRGSGAPAAAEPDPTDDSRRFGTRFSILSSPSLTNPLHRQRQASVGGPRLWTRHPGFCRR